MVAECLQPRYGLRTHRDIVPCQLLGSTVWDQCVSLFPLWVFPARVAYCSGRVARFRSLVRPFVGMKLNVAQGYLYMTVYSGFIIFLCQS